MKKQLGAYHNTKSCRDNIMLVFRSKNNISPEDPYCFYTVKYKDWRPQAFVGNTFLAPEVLIKWT